MKNIAFFGGGNIAQAVIEGLIISGFKKVFSSYAKAIVQLWKLI